MESFIVSERSKYISILKLGFHGFKEFSKMLKSNRKALIILAILFVGAPILSGLLVSFPFVNWLQTDNDWIGFWGSYIGGSIGAIIGDFVAYKVAQYGFNEQKVLDRENHITELKVEKISKFVSCILALQQRLTLHKSYINTAYNAIKSLYKKQKKLSKIKFDLNIFDISYVLHTIRNNREDIYNQLEALFELCKEETFFQNKTIFLRVLIKN